eukprot:scaffold98512_cov35-Prasinocladus_malaysianus.AAC.2
MRVYTQNARQSERNLGRIGKRLQMLKASFRQQGINLTASSGRMTCSPNATQSHLDSQRCKKPTSSEFGAWHLSCHSAINLTPTHTPSNTNSKIRQPADGREIKLQSSLTRASQRRVHVMNRQKAINAST